MSPSLSASNWIERNDKGRESAIQAHPSGGAYKHVGSSTTEVSMMNHHLCFELCGSGSSNTSGDLIQGQFFIVGEVQDQALAFRQISDCVRKSFLQVGTLKAKPCAPCRPATQVDDVFFSRPF
jgi:hypothetical protein